MRESQQLKIVFGKTLKGRISLGIVIWLIIVAVTEREKETIYLISNGSARQLVKTWTDIYRKMSNFGITSKCCFQM